MYDKISLNYSNTKLLLPIFSKDQFTLDNFRIDLSKYILGNKNNHNSEYIYSDFFKESIKNVKEILKKERTKRDNNFVELEEEVQRFQDNRRKNS